MPRNPKANRLKSTTTRMQVVDSHLSLKLGLTMKEIKPILRRGGDTAEKQFMECCWCLWKVDGIDLVEPFIEAAFNILPAQSRTVLFERTLTIVYVAQDSETRRPIV
jgi:hypothetical protein